MLIRVNYAFANAWVHLRLSCVRIATGSTAQHANARTSNVRTQHKLHLFLRHGVTISKNCSEINSENKSLRKPLEIAKIYTALQSDCKVCPFACGSASRRVLWILDSGRISVFIGNTWSKTLISFFSPPVFVHVKVFFPGSKMLSARALFTNVFRTNVVSKSSYLLNFFFISYFRAVFLENL